MSEERIQALESRVSMLEFKIELLADNTNTSRLLYENIIDRCEYTKLMSLMDKYKEEIEKGNKVYHHQFEQEIYAIAEQKKGDYHFCESLAQVFMEDGRWEDVFPELYGNMLKYKYYMETRKSVQI